MSKKLIAPLLATSELIAVAVAFGSTAQGNQGPVNEIDVYAPSGAIYTL